MQDFLGDTRTVLISSAILAGAIGFALAAHFALFFLAERLFLRKGKAADRCFA